jgi:hypothetical protein
MTGYSQEHAEKIQRISSIIYDTLITIRDRSYCADWRCPICFHDHLADGVQGEDFCEDERQELASEIADDLLKKFNIV